MSTPVEVLCRGVPAEFAMYLNYTRGLSFEEAPDYMYLRQLFRILFRTLNHQYDYTFDWTILRQSTDEQAAGASALQAPATSSQPAQPSAQPQAKSTNKGPSVEHKKVADWVNTILPFKISK